jgi:RNA-splicing ligase RtcB
VAKLPGIVRASYAMPDAHWGYGFPIGASLPLTRRHGGIVSAGVSADISCSVRTLRTGLRVDDILNVQKTLADTLARTIPAGVGSTGQIRLTSPQMDAMLMAAPMGSPLRLRDSPKTSSSSRKKGAWLRHPSQRFRARKSTAAG